MFYHKDSNQYINENTQFEIDGQQFPAQWLNQSTPEQKAAMGLTEVTVEGDAKNPAYYWTGETLADGVLTLSATPKDLTDVKKQAIPQVNAAAYSMLFPSDWMVVKAMETSTLVASDWTAYRAAVRAKAAEVAALVGAASDVDAVEAAMQITWPHDPNFVAPVAAE